MVQIQKVLSKHRALNQIVLHNHYYQKHAFKKKKILGFNLNFLNNVSFTGKFSSIFELKKKDFDFFKGFFIKKRLKFVNFRRKRSPSSKVFMISSSG
jgi:hypothetical protein